MVNSATREQNENNTSKTKAMIIGEEKKGIKIENKKTTLEQVRTLQYLKMLTH